MGGGGKGGGGYSGPSQAEINAQKEAERKVWEEEQAYTAANNDIAKYEKDIPKYLVDQARINEMMNRKGISATTGDTSSSSMNGKVFNQSSECDAQTRTVSAICIVGISPYIYRVAIT